MDLETRLAQELARNALTAFLASTLALLLLLGGTAFLLRRAESHWPARRPHLRLALAAAVLLGAAWLFLEMAEALWLQEPMLRFDQALAEALRQHLPAATLWAFAGLTHLGDTATLTVLCLLVAGALAWRRHRALAFAWVLAVAGNALVNTALKHLFARERPPHAADWLAAGAGFSFPSGHSAGAVAAYGMLAYVALRLGPARWQVPALLLAAGLAFTIGCSRVLLQVHYASDVLAGFASGLAWLALCVSVMEGLRLRQPAPPLLDAHPVPARPN